MDYVAAAGVIVNALAGLYQLQGQYAAAELLYKRALAIQERALGEDGGRIELVWRIRRPQPGSDGETLYISFWKNGADIATWPFCASLRYRLREGLGPGAMEEQPVTSGA